MAETEQRPLITFALFAYNQERYVEEAVAAAFAQDYSPLEIILSDDCSTDRTFEIMQEMTVRYDGSHRIVLNKNELNLGIGGHINKLTTLASGDLVVVAAGDDVSFPSRTEELFKAWDRNNRKDISIFSAMTEVDAKSQETGRLYRSNIDWSNTSARDMIKNNIGVFGASHAWSKEVMAKFPPLNSKIVNEDHVIPFRSVLLDGIFYIDVELVKYRANIGISSVYNDFEVPSFCKKRSPVVLRRPYDIYVQKCCDLRHVGSNLLAFAKRRRGENFLRYWLSKKGKITRMRFNFFMKTCRPSWTLREVVYRALYLSKCRS